jgi:hypothetical protein
MSTFAGQLLLVGPGQVSPKNSSSDVTGMTEITARSVSLSTAERSAHGPAQPSISLVSKAKVGAQASVFGGLLFERIIVLPRTEALQFVLTATQFAIEVWNTRQNHDDVLTAINITGSGGLTLADPLGEPLLYAAQDSRIYQATVPSSGSTNIDQDVVFVFASGLTGADCEVTGSRIVLFSVQPDWSEGMAESISYLTDVLAAYSDNEQRRGLRQFPRRALRFRALTLNARNAAGMESLIWGWQDQPYGVPWWPDATPITANVAAGSFSIPCNTVDRQFAAGGLCCIFQDEFTFEALTIEAVSPSAITVLSPTQFNWTANPAILVMPVFLARISDSIDVARYSSEIDQIDVQFIGEAMQAAPAPTTTLTQYKSIDVLEIPPNWAGAPLKRNYKRSMVTIDPKIGPVTVVDKGGTAIVGQPFPWWLDGHSNVTTFRAFILRRFGRLNSFWIPTWDQDLVLNGDVGPTDTGIVIKSEFYSRFFFPDQSRRFISFIPISGGPNVYREITAAEDNGNGTESLVLDSPTGTAFPAASTMISFLTLARLGSDDVDIEWETADFATANLELKEVPREVPS